ncbi:MAG: hypothetical protein DI549_07085 [Ancylobacter novellus]|uniref:Pentapeptide repeat-containing protein n=1 Tax=Ancylobacter novellus TaxID=921 RepID=A0A2W5R3Q6_ANCNO|nr:MAG: hypothetical protein DI549_07085 [Ancylobacter novellus]
MAGAGPDPAFPSRDREADRPVFGEPAFRPRSHRGGVRAMELRTTVDVIDANDVNLSGSVFVNVNLSGSRFDDVNMSGWAVKNVNFSGLALECANVSGARITRADLVGVSIAECRLDGMRIDGILVTDMLAAYRAAHEAN